ncbi:MAG: nicotinate-nucleotide diphosphorylase (carboxylating), partial [Nitrososphaerales archaeon]
MHVLREALAKFLEEDIGRGDVTSEILPKQSISAKIVCKERAVVAGLHEARVLFDLVKCRAKG